MSLNINGAGAIKGALIFLFYIFPTYWRASPHVQDFNILLFICGHLSQKYEKEKMNNLISVYGHIVDSARWVHTSLLSNQFGLNEKNLC